MTIAELDLKVEELRELQTMIEELTAQAESIKDLIKTKMIDEGSEVLTGNGWKATWRAVTSSRLDTKALKAAEPALYEKYSKESTVCRFTLN